MRLGSIFLRFLEKESNIFEINSERYKIMCYTCEQILQNALLSVEQMNLDS